MLGKEELASRFYPHQPSDGNKDVLLDLRSKFLQFAAELDRFLPDGRHKSLCLTDLETAAMWANKSVVQMDPVVKFVA
jgi:hypothetical protein